MLKHRTCLIVLPDYTLKTGIKPVTLAVGNVPVTPGLMRMFPTDNIQGIMQLNNQSCG